MNSERADHEIEKRRAAHRSPRGMVGLAITLDPPYDSRYGSHADYLIFAVCKMSMKSERQMCRLSQVQSHTMPYAVSGSLTTASRK